MKEVNLGGGSDLDIVSCVKQELIYLENKKTWEAGGGDGERNCVCSMYLQFFLYLLIPSF